MSPILCYPVCREFLSKHMPCSNTPLLIISYWVSSYMLSAPHCLCTNENNTFSLNLNTETWILSSLAKVVWMVFSKALSFAVEFLILACEINFPQNIYRTLSSVASLRTWGYLQVFSSLGCSNCTVSPYFYTLELKTGWKLNYNKFFSQTK